MEPTKKSPADPTARSSKSALLEAAQEAIAEQRSRPANRVDRPATGRIAFRTVLGGLLAAGAAVLVIQPEWLAGPKPTVEAPAVKSATATITLVQLVSRVQEYQEENGHLPANLSEIRGASPGVTYHAEPTGDFEVSLRAGDSVVSVRATDSLQARLVEALRIIQNRT